MSLKDYFERVFVINLDRRPDRWDRFTASLSADWPFVSPERAPAIDGKKCTPPEWWKQGRGAWGCLRSHLHLIEYCLNTGVRSVLLLEDDALFPSDFGTRISSFLENVPADWDMLYFGGQHLFGRQHPPIKINEWVYQPYNVNRTHAFALRERMIHIVYHHLLTNDWKPGHHIDHHLGRLHARRQHKIFCPPEWIVGQCDGRSDVSNQETVKRHWPAAQSLSNTNPPNSPFVAVIGLHSSGSSCLAGMLYHLGIHLGNKLGGFYGNDPENSCGFEAAGLTELCEKAIPFPKKGFEQTRRQIWLSLKQWINERRMEAECRGMIAGGKYPQLCRMGKQLMSICGNKLRVIHIDRPIEESISSLVKRCAGRYSAEKIESHQRWLCAGKQELLSQVQHLNIEYEQLLADPTNQMNRIIEYLQIQPDKAKKEKALAYVQPSRRHITPLETQSCEATPIG